MRVSAALRWVGCGWAAAAALSPCDTAARTPRSPRVAVETSAGRFTLELDSERTPQTVANFLAYVRVGFYEGLIFHRVVRGTLIQGGGFTTRREPRPTRPPIANEAESALPNRRYTIGMARGRDPSSATSQFYINLRDNPDLDPRPGGSEGYCVFGRVLEGTAVVDSIGRSRTILRDGRWQQPAEPVVILSARVLDEDPASETSRRGSE